MGKKLYYKYKNLFDQKIGNGTLLIFIIALLIILIVSFIPSKTIEYKTSLLEPKDIIEHSNNTAHTITINNKVYTIAFQELK